MSIKSRNKNWKLLAIFNEHVVFPNHPPPNITKISFKDRPTGKAIVYDRNGHIALIGNKINSFHLLPGGGIKTNESVEEGTIRECFEEIGCEVRLLEKVGVIEDYRTRDKTHCISYCHIAELVGEKGELQLTEDEQKNGLHVIWVLPDEAEKILKNEVEQLKNGKVEFYNTAFNILRDHLFLEKAKYLRNE